MTTDEAREFLDSATHEDCVAQYKGMLYFCYGLTWWEERNAYSLRVDKYKTLYPETDFAGTALNVESSDRNECMKHLEEDPIWDGKSFWQAAPDMQWTDHAGE